MPLRIATTSQLLTSVSAAGYEGVLLPALPDDDLQRGIRRRLDDGAIVEPFLRRERVDLVLDLDASALALSRVPGRPDQVRLTAEACGIPHATLYVDPVTSAMNQVPWELHWALLELRTWFKAVWETAHEEELLRLGVPNVFRVPMGVHDRAFDCSPAEPSTSGPVLAFMGHPATSWFRSQRPVLPAQLFPGFVAAAVSADEPGTPFHRSYFDLYRFAEAPKAEDEPATRARKSAEYFNAKFVYNAWLAVRQRDRFAIFLQKHLGSRFELIGDHWDKDHGLTQMPTIRDYDALYRRMRQVPICLNLMKGCLETGLNLRHFEVTAAGGFLLTYWTPELPDFFEVGKECETFRSERELLEKVRYYLAHADQRREIALAGQRRALADHLYSRRIRTFVAKLQDCGAVRRDREAAECPPRPVGTRIEGLPPLQDWSRTPAGIDPEAAQPGRVTRDMLAVCSRIKV